MRKASREPGDREFLYGWICSVLSTLFLGYWFYDGLRQDLAPYNKLHWAQIAGWLCFVGIAANCVMLFRLKRWLAFWSLLIGGFSFPYLVIISVMGVMLLGKAWGS